MARRMATVLKADEIPESNSGGAGQVARRGFALPSNGFTSVRPLTPRKSAAFWVARSGLIGATDTLAPHDLGDVWTPPQGATPVRSPG